MKQIFLSIAFVLYGISTAAQDPFFTQFYNNPLYLNPAFAGCGMRELRYTFNSRLQWAKLPDPLTYHSASADMYLRGGNMSAGFLINHFREGYLRTSTASAILAKGFGTSFEECRPWFLNFAFQVGYGRKSVNTSKLLFADQIDESGINGFSSEAEILQTGGKSYFDMGFGFLFTTGRVMAGAAGHHLTTPFDGLAGNGRDNRLPRRFSGHLSYLIGDMRSEDAVKFKPTIAASIQGQSSTLMAGALIDFGGYVQGSLWYRNNLTFQQNNNHSFVIGAALRFGSRKSAFTSTEMASRSKVTASYDAEINRPGARFTYGSQELGLSHEKYLFNDDQCLEDRCKDLYLPWWFF